MRYLDLKEIAIIALDKVLPNHRLWPTMVTKGQIYFSAGVAKTLVDTLVDIGQESVTLKEIAVGIRHGSMICKE